MICIRLVVNHDDNDADDVAIVVEITFSTDVVSVALAVLSFAVTSHVNVIASEVAFSQLNSSNDVMISPPHGFSHSLSLSLELTQPVT